MKHSAHKQCSPSVSFICTVQTSTFVLPLSQHTFNQSSSLHLRLIMSPHHKAPLSQRNSNGSPYPIYKQPLPFPSFTCTASPSPFPSHSLDAKTHCLQLYLHISIQCSPSSSLLCMVTTHPTTSSYIFKQSTIHTKL